LFKPYSIRGKYFFRNGEEVTGDWSKLHNKEIHDFYSSSLIIRVTKSKRMGRAGYVARMGQKKNAYTILVGKHK
jgi:hypothetical protein